MDITNIELFKPILEFKSESLHVDLHNDFTCVGLDYSCNNLALKLQKDNGDGHVILQFTNVNILRMQIKLQDKGLTLDNFHRGRYEFEGKLYDEYNEKKCFYIEFYEGGAIDLLCRTALIQLIW